MIKHPTTVQGIDDLVISLRGQTKKENNGD
jgi:hypothetical protein